MTQIEKRWHRHAFDETLRTAREQAVEAGMPFVHIATSADVYYDPLEKGRLITKYKYFLSKLDVTYHGFTRYDAVPKDAS